MGVLLLLLLLLLWLRRVAHQAEMCVCMHWQGIGKWGSCCGCRCGCGMWRTKQRQASICGYSVLHM
jgi:hypothetical protein